MSNPLNVQMEEIIDYAKSELQRLNDADCHWDVCQLTASKFNLWEMDGNGDESFPTWLSYVVQGVGRDEGILR